MRRLTDISRWCLFGFVLLGGSSAFCAQAKPAQRRVEVVAPAEAQPQAVPYYALVIGNNNYRHIGNLLTPINDANAFAQLLEQRYGFETKVLRDASRADILASLVEYRRTLPEDSNLLVYYAGHGHHDRKAEKAYWLPVDAENDSNLNWVSSDDITADLRAIPSRHILVISDSCYSGVLARDADVDITLVEKNAYLARIVKSISRTLMSSGSDEPVSDSGGGAGHSVFAGAILQALSQMEDNQFTAQALFQRIQPRVAGKSEQLPQYSIIRDSGHEDGDFVFSRLASSGRSAFWGKHPSTISGNVSDAGLAESIAPRVQARRWWHSPPQPTNRREMADLGWKYENGLDGLPKDEEQAVLWYRKSADAGDGRGLAYLGRMYEEGGGGLPKEEVTAVGWYRKSADVGDAQGTAFLASMYQRGRGGLPQDLSQAATLYQVAAYLGDAWSMCWLSISYLPESYVGLPLPKDASLAESWLEKARAAGEPCDFHP